MSQCGSLWVCARCSHLGSRPGSPALADPGADQSCGVPSRFSSAKLGPAPPGWLSGRCPQRGPAFSWTPLGLKVHKLPSPRSWELLENWKWGKEISVPCQPHVDLPGLNPLGGDAHYFHESFAPAVQGFFTTAFRLKDTPTQLSVFQPLRACPHTDQDQAGERCW